MEFKMWMERRHECENAKTHDMKEYKDGLIDRINARLNMVLQIYKHDSQNIDIREIPKCVEFYSNEEEAIQCMSNYYESLCKNISNREEELLIKDKKYRKEIDKIDNEIKKISKKVLIEDAESERKKKQNKREYLQTEWGNLQKKKEFMYEDETYSLLEDVTEEEGELYDFLLDKIPAGRDYKSIYQCVKRGEWWSLEMNVRIEIVNRLIKLSIQKKWYFIRDDMDIIINKLLRPHIHCLRESIDNLIYNILWLTDIGKDKIQIKLPEEDIDEKIVEIPYDMKFELDFKEDIEKVSHSIDDLVDRLDKRIEEIPASINILDEIKKCYERDMMKDETEE